MRIPTSFNAGLLSQLISPAWFLIFELNPSRATYKIWRLTRGSRVVTGRVGRVVLMILHTYTYIQKKKHRHQIRRRKASAKLFRNAPRPRFFFLVISSKNQLEAASSATHSFALLKDDKFPVLMAFALAFFFFFFLFRAQLYAANS